MRGSIVGLSYISRQFASEARHLPLWWTECSRRNEGGTRGLAVVFAGDVVGDAVSFGDGDDSEAGDIEARNRGIDAAMARFDTACLAVVAIADSNSIANNISCEDDA